MNVNPKIFLIVIFSCLNINIQAQYLDVGVMDSLVHYPTKIIKTIPLNKIRSFKFGNKNLKIQMLSGSAYYYDIYSNRLVLFCSFNVPPLVKLDENSFTDGFTIYPNPTENLVYIELNMDKISYVTIDIIDIYGNKIDLIFQGEHQGLQTYKWFFDRPKGIYFCRIMTNQNFITKAITIK
jgi:hypothetical protein